MTIRYVLGWFVLAIIAIINGALREAVYRNSLGDLAAHQLSTLTGIILFGAVIWMMTFMWPLQSSCQAWTIGIIWLAMTVCFEFLFGHYLMGHPWSKLLQDYNILEGRLWIVVLVWTVVAPYVFLKVQGRRS